MSHKHEMKIKKLFEHPMSGNIDVRRLLSALEHYGAELDMTKHNKVRITIKGEEFVLSLSHNNDLPKDSAVKLKHFLEKVDLVPENL